MTTETQVRERPILFSSPMVRALLAGRKTQTRRIVKGISDPDLFEVLGDSGEGFIHSEKCGSFCDYACGGGIVKCPYGASSDRLWVKETWRPYCHDDLYFSVNYSADGAFRKPDFTDTDRGLRFSDMCEQSLDGSEKWHPSIHMWREFSRITLEVTAVRVERVQAISEEDARAEGFASVAEFLNLFFNVNKRAPADSDPFVWCIYFKRVS